MHKTASVGAATTDDMCDTYINRTFDDDKDTKNVKKSEYVNLSVVKSDRLPIIPCGILKR